MKRISEAASKFLRLIEDSSLGGTVGVTFGGVEIGVYDDLEEMQNGIAEHIFNDLHNSEEGEEGEDYDLDSLRDDAIEQSLLVIDSFKGNTSQADADRITVEVSGSVEPYNGIWTFEYSSEAN
jgi:hypothetical protein